MLRSRIIYSVYLILALLALLALLYSNRRFNLKHKDSFIVSYMPNMSGICVYENTGKNTMKCNLTTVNTIISSMIEKDYFYIVSDMSYDNVMDVLISNGVDSYRILYNRETRDYACFSNPFEKSYIPRTYIPE